MKKKDSLFSSNSMVSDIKASQKAADLIQRGVDPDHIIFRCAGSSRRPFSTEIQQVDTYLSESSNEEFVRINMNREGLYDMLPEGLFHTLHAGSEILDEDVMIQDVRNKRRQEQNARKFFAPFENELFYLRTLLDQYESRLDMQTSHQEMSDLLLSNWPELQKLNARQRVIWMHFIPEIHTHKNDLGYAQQLLRNLLNIPIDLKLSTRDRVLDWTEINISSGRLGHCQLGVDSLTSMTYEINETYLAILIGPSYPQLLKNYLPNAKDEYIIHLVLDHLFPVQLNVHITYDLLPEVKHSYLSDKHGHNQSILGHTSYL
ncbi:hypothetical protein KUH03_00850 [Sphingobacterium sp. E70]|uniref:hypothetical protein n=1 Tax=Sphingobacterium sp. E70 TaxID=2853439 RepID=UPI00211CF24E|nr:hypothetical protein [Sphingobacterium sp. E70]ULT25594.1 hypothetical protein KUH03_00850 [Sphingobacterium sp. E70]